MPGVQFAEALHSLDKQSESSGTSRHSSQNGVFFFFSFASFLPAKTHRKDFWKSLLRFRLLSWCFYFMGSSWFITGSHAVLYNSKCKSIWENADPNSGEGSFSTISMEKVKESGEKQIVGSHPERLGKHSLKKLPKSSLMSASLGHTG